MIKRSCLLAAAVLLFADAGLLTAAPKRVSGTGSRGEPLTSEQVKEYVLSGLPPGYPHGALVLRIGGSGIYEMQVDTKTGRVNAVVVVTSAGHPILDRACIQAFKLWQFKPGGIARARVPVTFDPPPSAASKWVL